MKEFIFFTDTHYYLNSSRSVMESDGLSSWVHRQIDITKNIFTYAKENNVKNIIVGGDIFEEKDRIPSILYTTIWSIYYELSKDFNIYFNLGNHDIFMASGKTSIKPFSSIVNIISERSVLDIDGCKIAFIPFTCSKDVKVNESVDVCVTHAVIENITDVKMPINIAYKDLAQYPLVLNGHIHTHKILGNVVNVGSFMRHDVSEAGSSKYFLHYKGGDYKLIGIKCPDFFTMDYSEEAEKIATEDNYNFYRFNVPPSKANFNIFKKFNVSRKLIDEVKVEVRLEPFLTEEEEIVKYVEQSETQLDVTRLIKTGLELIGGTK